MPAALTLAAAFALAASSCGKRGDPLPPLRRVPEPAQNVRVAQRGDRIELSWVAPTRNQDGSLDGLELSNVIVLRRVLDIDALVEEQTLPAAEPETAEPETAEPETAEPETVSAEPEAAVVAEPAAEEAVEPSEERPTAAEPDLDPEPEGMEREGTEPDAPPPGDPEAPDDAAAPRPRPPLRFPAFGAEAETLVTRSAGEPGATASFGEPLDPGWVGKRVEYAIQYENRSRRRSPISEIAPIEPLEPLSAPSELEGEAADGFVALRWSKPAASPESEAHALSYALFRRGGASPDFPEAPLHGELLGDASFQDRTAPFGQPVCYVVKTVARPRVADPETVAPEEGLVSDPVEPEAAVEEGEPAPAEAVSESEPEPDAGAEEPAVPVVPVVPPISPSPRIESPPSEEACLTPLDTFAPDAPRDLVAVGTEEGILLSWRESSAPDLGGYRVYRADSPEGPFELLTEERILTPSFVDETAEAGSTSYYAVTAVDTSAAENESLREALVEARRPPPR